MTEPELKEDRAMLLEEWMTVEKSFADSTGDVNLVQMKLPRKVKRKRPIKMEDGTPVEYASSTPPHFLLYFFNFAQLNLI